MRRPADGIEYSANFAHRYFTGRDDILLTLVREGFARLRDAMATAAAPTGPGPAGGSTAGASGPAAAAARRAAHIEAAPGRRRERHSVAATPTPIAMNSQPLTSSQRRRHAGPKAVRRRPATLTRASQ
ncbi:hypothetical protein QFZ75_000512 [Streptomyces sp. V3I8]|nr:hypothetical protein [Streptomyces sp. V3I8]